MFGIHEDHFEERLATGNDSLREFAHNAGMDNPEAAWLLDSRDVWVANPFYSGPPQPHPEDDSHEDYRQVETAISDCEAQAAQVTPDEEIPF